MLDGHRPTSPDADGRLARRSRWATAGVTVVLLAVTVFALWSSQVTSSAAERAVDANALSDSYEEAARAVALEESLERKYRLEPSAEVATRYRAAADSLVDGLVAVRRAGEPADGARVNQVLEQHTAYLRATSAMFLAVDRGDAAEVLRIDAGEVDPRFASIEETVMRAADRQHATSLAELAHLQRLEEVSRLLTPVVFLCGLLLAGLLSTVTRGHRRLLRVERAQAIDASLHDALTGLANRTLLAERVGEALVDAEASGSGAALLLIDLDHFKEINDTFGHHYGDALLTQVGPRLSDVLKAGDTVARLGGDEFAVLLPGVSTQQACAAAARLRAALAEPFHVEDIDLDVDSSIGVVISGEHGTDATLLLQRADIAMYAAKAQGGGVLVYDPAIDGHSPAKQALLGDLRRAVEREELVLHYQPKVDLGTGLLIGAEALVRWQHPERGLVFPDGFIPLAERSGVIGPLTHYVLDHALAQARRWIEAGRPLALSVNLSARNLLDDNLPRTVANLLAVHRVPAHLLDLEVTESAIMADPPKARRLLEELSALGIRLSIDDFGAGYTSLSQLKDLPVSELKIDRSFVMTMTTDRSNALIVRSVIDLGHHLGLTIVAEGVEDRSALDTLTAMGCDVAQGYHLSRPVGVEQLDAWAAGRLCSAAETRAS